MDNHAQNKYILATIKIPIQIFQNGKYDIMKENVEVAYSPCSLKDIPPVCKPSTNGLQDMIGELLSASESECTHGYDRGTLSHSSPHPLPHPLPRRSSPPSAMSLVDVEPLSPPVQAFAEHSPSPSLQFNRTKKGRTHKNFTFRNRKT